MDFTTTKIDSAERAMAFFQAMGCRAFHMSREYPERYDEYKQLAIPRATEREWTYDSMNKMFNELRASNTKRSDLWSLHSSMETLAQDLKTEDALQQVYEATEAIVDRLPNRSKLLVAETINGRGAFEFRTGLIFLAQGLNRQDLVERFLEISLGLIAAAKNAGIEPERCDQALETHREIRKILVHPERSPAIDLDELLSNESPGGPDGGFVGLLRKLVLIAVAAGAVGSVGFTLRASLRNLSWLLLPLLTIWVLSPFVALLWANIDSKHWPVPTRAALYCTTLILTLSSLTIYREVAFGPSTSTPVSVFFFVPLGSWLLMALFVPIAVSISSKWSQ